MQLCEYVFAIGLPLYVPKNGVFEGFEGEDVKRLCSNPSEVTTVTNGGVKSAQTPPCDILFFSVCLESPENQVTQTTFRIKRKI